jgi:hypothetical protein
MSSSFRLKYFFGLIPSTQKIDSAWAELLKMRDELHQIEISKELARYNELKHLVQSNDFQTKKCDIERLGFKGSAEDQLINERTKLEHSKPIRDYSKFVESSDFVRLKSITESSELARYFELKKIVESPDFIRRKKEAESLRYKGSPEFNKRRELNALQKNSSLKHYFATIASDKYRLFLELETTEKENLNDPSKKKDPRVKAYKEYLNSTAYKNLKTVDKLGLPVQLEQLKQETNAQSFLAREAFLKNKARYETTPDFPLFTELAGLSKSCEIVFYLKCIGSPLYANYQKIAESRELARLKELRLSVEVPEFIRQVAFLKNKKRYETTAEFKLETELKDLEKNRVIIAYHQLKKRRELAFFDQWEIMLDENFTEQHLTDLWEPENYWGSKMAGCSFSQRNELQAYKGLKNIEVRNHVLSIVTKAEKTEGKVWDPSIGLVPKSFDYSSAILNTGNNFTFEEGVVEAKVRFRADKAITSAFALTGNRPFPQIDVFRSGNKNVSLGVINQPGKEGVSKLVHINGLNFSNFHIFRLEVFNNELVWKINNYEVHREQAPRNMGELFLHFIGSIHQPLDGGSLPHHFEIDWVRCLKKKIDKSS